MMGFINIIVAFYATRQGKSIDGLGNGGKGWLVKRERNGTSRCSNAWEAFVDMTDFVDGIPGPIVCTNRAKKKKFQLHST